MKCAILLFTFSLFPLIGLGNGSGQGLNTVHINELSFSQAVQQISSLSGYEVSVKGHYKPEGSFSVRIDHNNIDNTLKQLLKNFDYIIEHDELKRTIYLLGLVNDNVIANPGKPTLSVSNQKQKSTNKTASILELEDTAPIPVQYEHTGEGELIYRDTDGILEFVPKEKDSSHDYTNNYTISNIRADGLVEVISVEDPVVTAQNMSERYFLNTSVLNGLLELVPKEPDPPPIDGIINQRPDGIIEFIPINN